MALRTHMIDSRLVALDALLATLRPRGAIAIAVDRWRSVAAAMRFHLRAGDGPLLLAILGGTGTGKSTLVNRLLDANVSAASFRRTFTSGPVAVAKSPSDVPNGWLGVDRVVVTSEKLPASGHAGSLLVVAMQHELTQNIVLVDTPDLDGDQPLHHAQADRAFRWAQAVLFLVTPEKYQMTELLPYYRLAKRYALPALFVMNKCEEAAVAEDCARQLSGHFAGEPPRVFVIPRDDAAYEPPTEANLASLRSAIRDLKAVDASARGEGLSHRAADLIGRLRDQILSPLDEQRRDAEKIVLSLRALETASPGIDVNPLTQQLQRRLQQRSVLYLMGPGRMLDRVRQVPGLLARLPRTAWDFLAGRAIAFPGSDAAADAQRVPDFREAVIDQFRVVQSRVDDVLRSSRVGEAWITEDAPAYQQSRIDPEQAGKLVDDELNDLRTWLERRWNGTPRDTAILLRLLKHLPGGEKLTKLSEAAPYLLAIIVATHHAFFGPVDLVVIGGFSLFTWLTERISNEVASRTRQTNRKLAERFGLLAHDQIRRTIEWVEAQTLTNKSIESLRRASEELENAIAEK